MQKLIKTLNKSKEWREVSISIESTTLCPHFLLEFSRYKLLNAVTENICVMFDAPMA